MAIETLDQIGQKMNQLLKETIVKKRMSNDGDGREWALKKLDYSQQLKLEQLKEHVKRDTQNGDYAGRYEVKDSKSRKGISALKVEISALYSFSKCFVQRYKGRMHYYRDDLSQKGKRNMTMVGKAIGLWEEFKENLDK
jgi:hypothetical protein